MASGLSFDSDHHTIILHTPQPTVIDSMDTTSSSPPTTIQFPLNNNRTFNEMDFFANKKHEEEHSKLSNPSDDHVMELESNVNTGLHLVTGNTSSDQSVVDDGISPNSEDKRAKNELAVVQAELEKMNVENRKLKEVLNQITVNYNTLQTHLVNMMQEKERNGLHNDDGGGGGDAMMVPRPFMDLGLASGHNAVENNENSRSSSEHDKNSRSPPIQLEGSSEQGSQGTRVGSNKVPRLSASKSNATTSTTIDQATEATIRKARVSVRARSEAPMMDVNGGNMDRKWRREIHVHEHIIDALWPRVAQLENKYKDVPKIEQY